MSTIYQRRERLRSFGHSLAGSALPTPVAATPHATPKVSIYHTPSGEQALLAWYDKVRAALDFPTTSLVVPTHVGPTHLLAAGPESAPPVVLLHGMEGNALSWRGQMRALADSFRLYSLDIIGSAGKSAPARLSFAGHHHGEWLVDVLKGLDLPDAAFVGISNGSWLIVKLAALAPSRIRKAVLMSANGLVPVRFPYRLSRLLETPLGRRAHAAFSPRLVSYERIKRAMLATLPPGMLPDADEVEWWYLLARHYRYRFPPPTLLDDDLRQLTAPTMLLMGQRERFFHVPGVLERARRLLPNLHAAHIIPGAGHSVITEQPDVVNTHLRDFLSA